MFNDIRTTLQALIALYDNCNSLHTNAYDEAVTTPTAESVRRAVAIQQIINREWGVAMNHNPNQGSFVIEQLTDLVEQAVLDEFDRLKERGGVLGAMETGYQRGRIQDESLLYEQRKHDGTRPSWCQHLLASPGPQGGGPNGSGAAARKAHGGGRPLELARSTDEEKRRCLANVAAFRAAHADERPAALRAPAPGGAERRQPVRRPDGRCAVLHPGRDHRRPVRGGWPLLPQRSTGRAWPPGPAGRRYQVPRVRAAGCFHPAVASSGMARTDDRPSPSWPGQTLGLVTTGQLDAVGVTRQRRRTLISNGVLVPVAHGVLRHAAVVLTWDQQVLAVVLAAVRARWRRT